MTLVAPVLFDAALVGFFVTPMVYFCGGCRRESVLLWGWLGVGWLLNLFQALQHSQPLDPWLMLRWCGVVIPPLGGVIGWFPG